jgi:hypothetical protein
MVSPFLRLSSICAALTILLVSCRQPLDLDTDRTIVPTNAPEITDFSPKVGTFDEKITIVGKNFLNVERVMLDNIRLDSVRVENRNRITAQLPFGRAAAGVYKSGLRSFSVTTKSGVGVSRPEFALAWGMILGKITMNGKPLDSTEIFFRNVIRDKSGKASTSPRSLFSGDFAKGWFLANLQNIFSPSTFDSEEFTIRPFRSGYTFIPPERTIVTAGRGRITQVQEFEAVPTPQENMPTISAITPDTASSSGASGTPTGTEITIRGKGLSGVRRVLIGVLYPPFLRAGEYIYSEATILSVESDTQVTVRLPRLPSGYVVLGTVYTNCHVYVIRDDTSLLAPQRITVTSR